MNRDLQKISLSTSPQEILEIIKVYREKKNKSKETLELIDKTINTTQNYIVDLYFERAHVFQLMYMTERDKLEGRDEKKMANALQNMEKHTEIARNYIVENKLNGWFHRLYRFLGKVSEYKKNYKKAIEFYKESLKYWRQDPEVITKKLPRNLELEGFLASSLIMSGKTEKGLKMAKDVYKKYEITKEGRNLKAKDYTTWAIWRTGCVIYVTRGLLERKLNLERAKILKWLDEADRFLHPKKSVNTWADFQFRRDEISALRARLKT